VRQTARGHPATMEIVSEARRQIDSGWVERRGGGETTADKRWPLLPEWGRKEPPENP